MNAQEKRVLEVFGQRLDDHVRACEEIHRAIRDEARADRESVRDEARVAREAALIMSSKVDSLIASNHEYKGGKAAISWMIVFGIAVLSTFTGIAGIVSGIIIQIKLH